MNIKPNMVFVIMMAALIFGALYFKNKPANSAIPSDMPIAVSPPVQEPKPDPKIEIPEVEPEIKVPRTVSTYTEALAAAKEANCNIFLYFGAPWCGYCEQMKSTTLASQAVKDKLSNNFVVLIINTDEEKSIARKFGVRGIPAYMVVNDKGNVLRRTTGYKPPTEFLRWLGDK